MNFTLPDNVFDKINSPGGAFVWEVLQELSLFGSMRFPYDKKSFTVKNKLGLSMPAEVIRIPNVKVNKEYWIVKRKKEPTPSLPTEIFKSQRVK